MQKDHHLRPQRLRRTTAARHASYSGEHSLAVPGIIGITLFSDKSSPPVRVFLAGGQPPKTSLPPTSAASPEDSYQKIAHLRPAFASRK